MKAKLDRKPYCHLAYCEKVSYNNLTYYWRVPLQFAWQDLRTDFFEFDAGHEYDRSMPYMFGICVFRLFFRLQSNSAPRFLADVDGLVSWPRSKHGKLFNNFSRWSLVPIRRNSYLLGLSFSLDPVIQADIPIKQCCNFSRDSFAFETDRDM